MTSHRFSLYALASLAAVSAHAEEPISLLPVGDARSVTQTCGIAPQAEAGVYLAGGADYRAEFSPAGMTFVPALGKRVQATQHLSLDLVRVERGGVAVETVREVAPRQVEDTLLYEHSTRLLERYAVRPEGVELSYVFTEPLAGAGDLVVRLKLDTSLPLSHSSSQGLLFDVAGIGGVSIGAVTGIDAQGRTVTGEVRYDGAAVEFVLPESFVGSAAYPVILDPLVGAQISVAVSGMFDDTRPDVAFESANTRYLVVWQRAFSASDSDIRGQIVYYDGSLIGGLITFPSAGVAENPSVANVAIGSRFLVVWEELSPSIFTTSYKVRAAEVSAAGAIESTLLVAESLTDPLLNPDVCGNTGPGPGSATEFLVVYDDQGADEIRVQPGKFTSAVSGGMSLTGAPLTVFSDSSTFAIYYTRPTIARSTGWTDRSLLTVVRRSGFFGPGSIRGQVINVDGTLIGSSFLISNSSDDCDHPDVDGNGNTWVCAFEATNPSGDVRIDGASIAFNASTNTATVGAMASLSSSAVGGDSTAPAVGFSPGKTWLGYTSDSIIVGGDSVRLRGYDTTSCLPCEGSFKLGTITNPSQSTSAVATSHYAFSLEEVGLAVWTDAASGGDIYAHAFNNTNNGGSVVNIGGGCGTGGTANFYSMPAIGTANWLVSATNLPNNAAITFLNFSFADPGLAAPCGNCLWMPFQIYTTLSVSSIAIFGASLGVTIPCKPSLVGTQFTVQWTTPTPSSSPCSLSPQLSMSDRWRCTIGQ